MRRKTSKDQEKKVLLLEKKYEGIAVLFEEFANSSLAKQSAFLVFSLKAIIESLVVGLLFEYPLFQAILLLLLTLFLLAYNIIKRPFKSTISLAQQLVLVLSLFICNILLNVMAGTDLSHENFQTVKERTSQGIFWILIMFQFIPLFFFGINLIEGAWIFYKWFSFVNKPKKITMKRPHRLAKDQDHSLDQTVLSLNQSRVHLVDLTRPPQADLETSPSQVPLAKILNPHSRKSPQDFAKDKEKNPKIYLSQARKRKIARPPCKIIE